MPLRIYFASGNAHKAAELQQLADAHAVPVAIVSARAAWGGPAVDEDTGTFVGNARKKAVALRDKLGGNAWVLADDSGVCVDALDGAPGVESAYYAGPQADPVANVDKLLAATAAVPDKARGASFRCVLLVLTAAGEEHVFEGICGGQLLRERRGSGGFGYDPIFVPDGFTASYAELGDDVKNRISHRAQAFAKFAAWLKTARVV